MWEGTSFWLPRRRHTNHDWAESRREKIGNWFSSIEEKKSSNYCCSPPFPSPLYIWEISHYFFFLLRYYSALFPFLGGCAIESGDSAALLPTESEGQQSACRISDIFAAFSAFIAASAERRMHFLPRHSPTLQCNLHLTGTMMEFFKQPVATAKKNIYSTAEGGRFLAPQLCCDTWQKPIERAREGGG